MVFDVFSKLNINGFGLNLVELVNSLVDVEIVFKINVV